MKYTAQDIAQLLFNSLWVVDELERDARNALKSFFVAFNLFDTTNAFQLPKELEELVQELIKYQHDPAPKPEVEPEVA